MTVECFNRIYRVPCYIEIVAIEGPCIIATKAGREVTRRLVILLKGILPQKTKKKQTPWPLVRVRTIPTERPPPVDEI
jgi:hypothetical protein